MKLYYLPGASSFTPHVALEWTGAEYSAQAVDGTFLKSAEYLALNPKGAAPVLVDGDLVLSQNDAILHYLDEVYPEAKLFGSKTVRDKARASRWLSFFNSDLHPAFQPLFRAPAFTEGNEELLKTVRKDAVLKIMDMFAIANEHLENHIFFGEQISVADVYLYTILNWCRLLGLDFSHLEQLSPFMQRVEANKGVDNARSLEGLK